MNILILLFRYGRLCVEERAASEKAADQALDRVLTAVLHGEHGNGEFRLHAEHVDDLGGFKRGHFDQQFVHPAPKVPKPV